MLEDKEEFQILLNQLGNYKAIILHGLFFPWQERVLRAVPKQVKVAWVFWGGDIYGRTDICGQFLSPRSKKLLLMQNIKRIVKGKRPGHKYEIPLDLLKRIDYCLTDIPEDFSFVKPYLGTDIKELWYNYYSVEETIGELGNSECNGRNILIGNSCSLECNHIDGIRIISKLKIPKESLVYCPLSYGESWLRTAVTERGRKMLGGRFSPLTAFLPRDEYNAIICSCSCIVMPHCRPQAFGNILTALWLGSRVFLSERNILFGFFRRVGAQVFSIENDLIPDNPMVFSPLNDEERTRNRQAISAIYSKEIMHRKNLEIVKLLNQ